MGVPAASNGKTPNQLANEILKRNDAKLMCETCRLPTLHCFVERVKIGFKLFDVMYECSRCGTHRVYGRESDGKPDTDED